MQGSVGWSMWELNKRLGTIKYGDTMLLRSACVCCAEVAGLITGRMGNRCAFSVLEKRSAVAFGKCSP